MRRALGEQPVVVAAGPLAPASVGVVRRLLGQHHEVVAEVDRTVVVAACVRHAGVSGAHERQGYRRNAPVESGGRPAEPLVASDDVTTPSGASPGDEFWRRPPNQPPTDETSQPTAGAGAGDGPTPGATAAGPGGYTGPPPTTPPPPGWRPPVHLQMPPPRQLPPQDVAGMDGAEQQAQRFTYGIGAVVAVVLVLLVCLLCSRVIL